MTDSNFKWKTKSYTIINQPESLAVHLSEKKKKKYKCLTDEGYSHNVMTLFELHYIDKSMPTHWPQVTALLPMVTVRYFPHYLIIPDHK